MSAPETRTGTGFILSLETVLRRALALLAEPQDREDRTRQIARLFDQVLKTPDAEGGKVMAIAGEAGLTPAESLALFCLLKVETDPEIAVLVGALQVGEARFRPTPQCLADLVGIVSSGVRAAQLLSGPLFRLPLARLSDTHAPAPLAPVRLGDGFLAALDLPSELKLDVVETGLDPPAGWREAARHLADRLKSSQVAVVVRSGLPEDQSLFAACLADTLGRRAVRLPASGTGDRTGLGFGLRYAGALPVEVPERRAGARTPLADLTGYRGPRIALLGPEGGIEAPGWSTLDVTLPPMSDSERAALWAARGGDAEASGGLPFSGSGPSRLAAVATRFAFSRSDSPALDRYRTAAGEEARPDLEPHGQLVGARVGDAALVASPPLKTELDLLVARCRARRRSGLPLGPAMRAKGVDTGVRALFTGPPGGGKTLACSWLSTRLGLPLFRVDLAAIVSKYIGETEENLSRILDRAEAADVMLLFDEADSLFGARTDVSDSSDRFANNQTNYLLSRIETYGGIVLMTSNGRERIDPAFFRRLDQIIDVPIPGALERHGIWCAHLGENHVLSGLDLNQLSTDADISGGHIRAIVTTAAVLAGEAGTEISMTEISRALELEYRKTGRTPPGSLVRR